MHTHTRLLERAIRYMCERTFAYISHECDIWHSTYVYTPWTHSGTPSSGERYIPCTHQMLGCLIHGRLSNAAVFFRSLIRLIVCSFVRSLNFLFRFSSLTDTLIFNSNDLHTSVMAVISFVCDTCNVLSVSVCVRARNMIAFCLFGARIGYYLFKMCGQ